MNGWLAVGVVVAAYDCQAALRSQPTMSACFRAASRKHPVVIAAATGYLLAHLYGALPRRYDPLSAFRGNQ